MRRNRAAAGARDRRRHRDRLPHLAWWPKPADWRLGARPKRGRRQKSPQKSSVRLRAGAWRISLATTTSIVRPNVYAIKTGANFPKNQDAQAAAIGYCAPNKDKKKPRGTFQ